MNQTFKNSLEAQSLVKELITNTESLNALLLDIRKRQDKLLNLLGVQVVQITNI